MVRLPGAPPPRGTQAADPVRGPRRPAIVAARRALPIGGLQSHQRAGPGGVHVELPQRPLPAAHRPVRVHAPGPAILIGAGPGHHRGAAPGPGQRQRARDRAHRMGDRGTGAERFGSQRHRGLGRRRGRRRISWPPSRPGSCPTDRSTRDDSASPAPCACRSRSLPASSAPPPSRWRGTSPSCSSATRSTGPNGASATPSGTRGRTGAGPSPRDLLAGCLALERGIDAWWTRVADDPVYPLWLRGAALNELYYDVFGGVFWENGCITKPKRFGARPGPAPVLHVGDRRLPGLRVDGRPPLRGPASARAVSHHRARPAAGMGRHGATPIRMGRTPHDAGSPSTILVRRQPVLAPPSPASRRCASTGSTFPRSSSSRPTRIGPTPATTPSAPRSIRLWHGP